MLIRCLVLPLAAMAAISLGISTGQAETQRWIRDASVSPDGERIAFSYRGQIFTVPAAGGEASAITPGRGHNHSPVWSPDSRDIAFASDVNGDDDVFVTDDEDGFRRLTWTSYREVPTGFSSDGNEVLFTSVGLGGETGSLDSVLVGRTHLYSVDLQSGRRDLLLPVVSSQAQRDASTGRILYTYDPVIDPPTRQHRVASNARQIWLFDEEEELHERLFAADFDMLNAVWGANPDEVFFLSEESGRLNVWSGDIAGGTTRQLTFHEDHPVRFLSVSDDGDVFYVTNGALYRLDRGANEPQAIEVSFAQRVLKPPLRSRGFEASEFVSSPDGGYFAVVIAGEVHLLDREGNSRQITRTPEPERDVSFSPDGRQLVYAAHRNGVWGVYGIDLGREMVGNELALAYEEVPLVVGEGNAFQPMISPDGAKLAYVYARREVRVLDLATGETASPFREEDYVTSYSDGDMWFSWSPDSRHLVVSWKTVPFSTVEKAGIVPADASEPIRSVSENVPSFNGAFFHGDGTQILGLTQYYSPRLLDQAGILFDLYRIYLSDEARARFLTSPGEDEADEEGQVSGFDFQPDRASYLEERLTQQSIILYFAYPLPDSPHLVAVARDISGSMSAIALDLRDGSIEEIADLDGLDVEMVGFAPGPGLLDLKTAQGILSIPLGQPDARQQIAVSVESSVDPRARRLAAFDQIWADLRSKYYRADIEGRDWDEIGRLYRGYLDDVSSDRAFAGLIDEMFGEISASHLLVRYSPPTSDGMIGTRTASIGLFEDHEHRGPGTRIADLLPGGPLDRADLDVEVGDVVVSVNGIAVPDAGGLAPLLDGMEGKRVQLGIMREGQADEGFVAVMPIGLELEHRLNRARWVDTRREMVRDLGRGCIAYVHVAGMDNDSYVETYGRLLARRDDSLAALVDVRSNLGGNLHRQLMTLLTGEPFALVGREGRAWSAEPLDRWTKPSAVIVDSVAYSDGAIFPRAYQDAGVGPVIGDRLLNTGTGVDFIQSALIPGLTYGIPVQPFRGLDGNYYENSEIEPDVLVAYDPNAAQQGRDLKLEAAVAIMMDELGEEADCR